MGKGATLEVIQGGALTGTVHNPGTPRPESNWNTILAGLLAHRSASLAQPSQPFRPVACRGCDSLFTVAGAALELAAGGRRTRFPFDPLGRKKALENPYRIYHDANAGPATASTGARAVARSEASPIPGPRCYTDWKGLPLNIVSAPPSQPKK